MNFPEGFLVLDCELSFGLIERLGYTNLKWVVGKRDE